MVLRCIYFCFNINNCDANRINSEINVSATKRAPARDSNRKNKKNKIGDKTEDETEVNMQNEDKTSAEEDIETRIEHSDLNGNKIDVDSDQDVQQVEADDEQEDDLVIIKKTNKQVLSHFIKIREDEKNVIYKCTHCDNNRVNFD